MTDPPLIGNPFPEPIGELAYGGTMPGHHPFVGIMPRYFFDTDDGDGFLDDKEGLDLTGIEEARLQAQSALADMARDVVPGTAPQRTMLVRVLDESGKVVLTASLVLRVEIKP